MGHVGADAFLVNTAGNCLRPEAWTPPAWCLDCSPGSISPQAGASRRAFGPLARRVEVWPRNYCRHYWGAPAETRLTASSGAVDPLVGFTYGFRSLAVPSALGGAGRCPDDSALANGGRAGPATRRETDAQGQRPGRLAASYCAKRLIFVRLPSLALATLSSLDSRRVGFTLRPGGGTRHQVSARGRATAGAGAGCAGCALV